MKISLSLLLIMALSSGCKKTVENVQQDLVLLAMTDGKWKVTSFIRNSVDITADYANYRFKYYSNKTVDAINAGVVERTGQWDGNAENRTTWANFNGAPYPLDLINGTWNIMNNSWTHVTASQNGSSGDLKIMRLEKE